jgi:hypothetical protein
MCGPETNLRLVKETVAMAHPSKDQEDIMGRGILLWLLGIPIPIIILLALLWH